MCQWHAGWPGNSCREGPGSQVCTCDPNGYCRNSAGTLAGGQYGSKGRGVEPRDESVARPVRPMETAEVFPMHLNLGHDPFQLILGTPLATVVSLLWRCQGPKARAGSRYHLSSGTPAGRIRDCKSALAFRTALAGSLPSPPGDGIDRILLIPFRCHLVQESTSARKA